ncbi:MAG: DUF3048 domain-containing protein [Anaerolineae bacterium]|nr:DUF3048 domain-containing protein [Anaerolineae bacterium]
MAFRVHPLLVLLMLAAAALACVAPAAPTAVVSPSADSDGTAEVGAAIVENLAAAGINPLTGQPAANPGDLERRPMVVKISNAPPLVRPQAGLGSADMVFEHLVEGGLTRFSAVFYGQAPTRVGSIRSARLIDLELTPMFQGLLIFSGASTGVESRLNAADFAGRLYKAVAYGLPYAWRDETIEAPHNLFVNLAALWELAAQQGNGLRPALNGLTFSNTLPLGGSADGRRIDVRYPATRVVWEYDAALGVYRRTADGMAHLDGNTLQPITAANVVVVYAEHQDTDIVESQWEGVTSYSIDIRLAGEGEAVLFRDGQRTGGRWVRPARDGLIGLRTVDGQMLDLKPGITWVQVVRLAGQQNPGAEWVRWE